MAIGSSHCWNLRQLGEMLQGYSHCTWSSSTKGTPICVVWMSYILALMVMTVMLTVLFSCEVQPSKWHLWSTLGNKSNKLAMVMLDTCNAMHVLSRLSNLFPNSGFPGPSSIIPLCQKPCIQPVHKGYRHFSSAKQTVCQWGRWFWTSSSMGRVPTDPTSVVASDMALLRARLQDQQCRYAIHTRTHHIRW